MCSYRKIEASSKFYHFQNPISNVGSTELTESFGKIVPLHNIVVVLLSRTYCFKSLQLLTLELVKSLSIC